MSDVRHYAMRASPRGAAMIVDPLGSFILATDYYDLVQERRVSEMREKLLDSLLRAVISEMESEEGDSRGNAPGHCHDVPGIWDPDNGQKAGKQCAWCLLWAMAKQAVKQPDADGAVKS